jgi:diguanylate cyclase (GGDEF)-like protein/PAS domain S-box-containing protein
LKKEKKPPMISLIKQWFAPPVFEGDEEKTRRASLLNMTTIIGLIYISLFISINLLGDSTQASSVIIIAIGVFFATLLFRYWLRHGKVALVGGGLVILTFIWITLIGASLGTIRTPTTATYLFVVILSGFLFDWSGILISSIASSLAVMGLILAENAGMLPQPNYTVTFTQWFTYTSLFVITGYLSFFMFQTTRKALAYAKKEIEARKQVESILREGEEKFRSIVEYASNGIVLTDEQGVIVEWNPAQENISGMRREEALGRPLWEVQLQIARLERRTPEVVENLKQVFQHMLASGEIPERVRNQEAVVQKANGVERVVHSVVFSIKTPRGFRLAGIAHDITARKQAEETVNRRNQELATLYETSLQINSISDVSDLMHITIQRACDLLKIQSGALYLLKEENVLELLVGYNVPQNWIGKKIRSDEGLAGQVVQSRQPVMVSDYLSWEGRLSVFENSPARRTLGVPLQFHNQVTGVVVFIDSRVGLFSDEDVHLVGLFIDQAAIAIENARLYASAQHEIEERQQVEIKLSQANDTLQTRLEEIRGLQAELREQVIRDPLTSVFNRRYLNETMAREIARAERENDPLSIIMSDIDHFKMINDTYGHPVGDKFLVEIASLMKNYARSSDIICRYGGEEFLLALPGTPMESAEKRAEEIRQKCAEIIIQHEGKNLKVTISFGVATYPDHGKEAEEIIINADKAMYQSKKSGRNRVTVWGENR